MQFLPKIASEEPYHPKPELLESVQLPDDLLVISTKENLGLSILFSFLRRSCQSVTNLLSGCLVDLGSYDLIKIILGMSLDVDRRYSNFSETASIIEAAGLQIHRP